MHLEAYISHIPLESLSSQSSHTQSQARVQGVGGALQRTLQLHKDWVRAIAINEDASLLVSGSSDLTVKVWDFKGFYRGFHNNYYFMRFSVKMAIFYVFVCCLCGRSCCKSNKPVFRKYVSNTSDAECKPVVSTLSKTHAATA